MPPPVERGHNRPSGGRTWWAHFEFTRINIALTILRKRIADLREAGATLLNAAVFVVSYARNRTGDSES
jgi:hypothetical protein